MVLKVSLALRIDSLGELTGSDNYIRGNSVVLFFSVADLRDTAIADVPSGCETTDVSLLLQSASTTKTVHLEVNDLLVEIVWIGLIRLHRCNN